MCIRDSINAEYGDARLSSMELCSLGLTGVSKHALEAFARLDYNRDGKICQNELMADLLGRGVDPDEVAGLFKCLDRDGDGQISLDEFVSGWGEYSPFTSSPSSQTRPGYNPRALDFSFLGTAGTRIHGAENRAITLEQLFRVKAFILSHADRQGLLPWLDLSPIKYNVGRLLTTSINMYQLNDWMIVPATQEHGCSLVELMCPDGTIAQLPTTFVSHWWGEAVLDFILAVETHANVRGLTNTECYWVCAYANNQNELEMDIGVDPKQSCFYLAMTQSTRMLLILDKDATPFVRIWCCFELAMWIKSGRALDLDISTVVHGSPELLTHSLTCLLYTSPSPRDS
eukprot:TRINITY_DN29086_c0_g1_i2.p1 TRINITY_DN29086_c0_g1~~TRINITY_DN29086_c0_g1_i2.p1  ORF type:complete len:343 (+),score=85.99 TRINITY_DN29086_c0_g1_i2:185-1213(+)